MNKLEDKNMVDAQDQLHELIDFNQHKDWNSYRFYKEDESDSQVVFSISRELDGGGYTDLESDVIQNLCEKFGAKKYEITVITSEDPRKLKVKFYNIKLAVDALITE